MISARLRYDGGHASDRYRPAISLCVFHRLGHVKNDLGWLVREMRTKPELTIVYVPARSLAQEVCNWLQSQGVRADFYHKVCTSPAAPIPLQLPLYLPSCPMHLPYISPVRSARAARRNSATTTSWAARSAEITVCTGSRRRFI